MIILTNVVSPHILPLAKELVNILGEDKFLYLATGDITEQRKRLGWEPGSNFVWVKVKPSEQKIDDFLRQYGVSECDVLICTLRHIKLLEEREIRGRLSIFLSERWAKPPLGFLRLLSPRFLVMALRMRKLLLGAKSTFYFAIGLHAARDIATILGTRVVSIERTPCGKVECDNKKVDNIRIFGYTVDASHALPAQKATNKCPIRVLWVGRFLRLKRVGDIVRAVARANRLKRAGDSLPNYTLTLVGAGPEEKRLRHLAEGLPIEFRPSVPIRDVRKLMREHDVYILASNAYEGWGAVVSEALEEGMTVYGTYESGSCSVLLPDDCLFHCGDVERLTELLLNNPCAQTIGEWSARAMAHRLMSFCERKGARHAY